MCSGTTLGGQQDRQSHCADDSCQDPCDWPQASQGDGGAPASAASTQVDSSLVPLRRRLLGPIFFYISGCAAWRLEDCISRFCISTSCAFLLRPIPNLSHNINSRRQLRASLSTHTRHTTTTLPLLVTIATFIMLAISNHEHNASHELTMTVLGCGMTSSNRYKASASSYTC